MTILRLPCLCARAGAASLLVLVLGGCASAPVAVPTPAPPGPRWQLVPASELTVCASDGPRLVRVTRPCACGQTLSCRVEVAGDVVRLEVRLDPDARDVCTECSAVSTTCPLPAGAPASVSINGAAAQAMPGCAPSVRP